jgi:hypothetical protein
MRSLRVSSIQPEQFQARQTRKQLVADRAEKRPSAAAARRIHSMPGIIRIASSPVLATSGNAVASSTS